jgi:hypothetical protein
VVQAIHVKAAATVLGVAAVVGRSAERNASFRDLTAASWAWVGIPIVSLLLLPFLLLLGALAFGRERCVEFISARCVVACSQSKRSGEESGPQNAQPCATASRDEEKLDERVKPANLHVGLLSTLGSVKSEKVHHDAASEIVKHPGRLKAGRVTPPCNCH